MNLFDIAYSEQAVSDIAALVKVITVQYKSPVTATQYTQGIIDTIASLRYHAEAYRIQTGKSFQQYGPFPRRVNYKQMKVIYNVLDNTVYIRRVIPANTIAEP
jgi:plasmid stabilization system protein ParE